MKLLYGFRGAGYVYKFESESDLKIFIEMNPELCEEANEMLYSYRCGSNAFRFHRTKVGNLDWGSMHADDYIDMGYHVVTFSLLQRSE